MKNEISGPTGIAIAIVVVVLVFAIGWYLTNRPSKVEVGGPSNAAAAQVPGGGSAPPDAPGAKFARPGGLDK